MCALPPRAPFWPGASELGEGQLPLKPDEGQNPAPGVPQAVVMGYGPRAKQTNQKTPLGFGLLLRSRVVCWLL